MTIIIPIHVEALRVTSNTSQEAKTALYKFDELGKVASSAGSGMIAAENFSSSVTNLGTQPGIHLHWSLPRAYTKGTQNRDTGAISFPVLPNRWLVIRMLKNAKPGAGKPATDTRLWMLESDAHTVASGAAPVGGSLAPWMDNSSDIQGLKGNLLGRKLHITDTWSEPNTGMQTLAARAGSQDPGYLGSQFQAPYGSGETFTAYLPSSGNILGLYDPLDDYFTKPNQLTTDAEFSASYFVVGWVSDTASDICNITLKQALADYGQLPSRDKPSLEAYIEQIMTTELKWSLSDYGGLTASAIPTTQAVMSGLVADITWKMSSGSVLTYPTGTPTQQGIKVSIGSNTADALSAYLNGTVLDPFFNPNAPEVDQKTEWLLNALQFDQLPKLDSGAAGVGQLQEFLHSSGFSSAPGGYVWAVQQDRDSTQSQGQGNNNEVPLPPYLGKVLADLNTAQRAFDQTRDKIASQRRQLFLDWSYHAGQLQSNVFGGSGQSLTNDVTGSFVVDGILHYFPMLYAAGNYTDLTQPTSAYVPTADSFNIALPAAAHSSLPSDIASYSFLSAFNPTAGGFASELVNLAINAEATAQELVPLGLSSLRETVDLLELAQIVPAAAPSAQSQISTLIDNAIETLTDASKALKKAAEFAADLTNQTTGVEALSAEVTRDAASIKALVTAFKGYTTVTTVPTPLPLPPATAFKDTLQPSDAQTLAQFASGSAGFPGVKELLDTYGGAGGKPAFVSDTSLAGYYLACAHIYVIQSSDPWNITGAYYMQYCLQTLMQAEENSTQIASDLTAAAAKLTGVDVAAALAALETIASQTLASVQADLSATPANISGALASLNAMLGQGATDLPAIAATLLGQDWRDIGTDMQSATKQVLDRLPGAQQVSIYNTALYDRIKSQFELVATPANSFSAPNEPVILMGQDESGETILKPFTRNGKADIIPCRMPSEIVNATHPPDYPAQINSIGTKIKPTQRGLSAVFQSLAQEAVLLTPELGSPVTENDLAAAAKSNETIKFDANSHVALNPAPTGLTGKLPYYVAYNWRTDNDPFLPLFIWWNATYTFSDKFDLAAENLPADFMKQFKLGSYEVENHLTAASKGNFTGGSNGAYSFDLRGVIAMSSNATYSLCEQISKYCMTYLDYDPKLPPDKSASDYDTKALFHGAYTAYKSKRILSQGLSGFNPALVQRVQEMQLPVNIPTKWTSGTLSTADFWPTQFLHAQSADWPANWNDLAPNPLALQSNAEFVDFNPLRAGKLSMQAIQLVDVFGRYVSLTAPEPTYVAESMSDTLAPNDVYLPPRIVQPARVNFDWIGAQTSLSARPFAEPGNAIPAVSPVCGWLWPNHLDNSVSLYDHNGQHLGSLGLQGTPNPADGPLVHWFPVPGKTTSVTISNRQAMMDYLQAAGANSVFTSVLTQFLFGDATKATATQFNTFLAVLEKSQSFVITKALQNSADLSLFVGRPLVVTQAEIGVELKGNIDRASDYSTYPKWNENGPQFTLTSSEYIPYHLDNFNDAGLPDVTLPTRVGTAMVKLPNQDRFPYFDDGLSGYFVDGDFTKFYTPVELTSSAGIVSLSEDDADFPVKITPNGRPSVMTFIMDPRAAVHATTGVLPVSSVKIPEEQFNRVLRDIEITFLTAPVLTRTPVPELPIPPQPGFEWEWVTTLTPQGSHISGAQNMTNPTFPDTPQSLVDGWLLMKRADG
ncbi:hypothetical protein [Yoonia maritima]|uniref:hypothetical protein n=1 Tax=Yoonia maritima TaxID=1435347 RepID=UPI000D113747|nr:hypothetical protein [Yoonia maritima]